MLKRALFLLIISPAVWAESRFAVVHGTVPDATASASITNSELGGEVGDAWFTMLNSAVAVDTITANAGFSAGLQYAPTDEAFAYAYSFYAVDGATTGNQSRTGSLTGEYTNLRNEASTQILNVDNFDDDIVDGIQMRSGLNTGNLDYKLSAGVFNGSDVSRYLVLHTLADEAADSTIVVSSQSFQAEALIIMGIQGNGTGDTGISIGIACDAGGGTEIQRSYTYEIDANGYASVVIGELSDNYAFQAYNLEAAQFDLEVTAFSSTGYTLTVRNGVADTGGLVSVFGIASTDWDFKCIDFTTPTSGTGVVDADINLSSAGGALRIFTHIASATGYDTAVTDNTAAAWSMDMTDGTVHKSASISLKDNVSTWVAKSHHGDGIAVLDGDGALDIDGTTAVSTSGWTDTYSNFPAAQTQNFALVFGPTESASAVAPRAYQYYRQGN